MHVCRFPAIQFDTQHPAPNLSDALARCLHQLEDSGQWKLIFWFALAPAWIFSTASKYFIVRRRLFFSNDEAPESNKIGI